MAIQNYTANFTVTDEIAGHDLLWRITQGSTIVESEDIPTIVYDPTLDKSIELFPESSQDPYFADIKYNEPFGDVDREEGLDTTVFLALFTDARALDTDTLPNSDNDKRGWWGDELLGISTGSKEWIITERGKLLKSNLEIIRQYRLDALNRQIISQGLADSATVDYIVGINSVEWTVVLQRKVKNNVSFVYETLWDGQLKKGI